MCVPFRHDSSSEHRSDTTISSVDILVNSLAGDSLIASWELMAPHGRFLELGRADINGNSNLPMMTFKNNVSFTSIAIDYLIDHRPVLIAKMLNAVTDMIVRGELTLPSPLRSYSWEYAGSGHEVRST